MSNREAPLRVLDVILSILGLLPFSVLLLVYTPILMLVSPGPIIVSHDRIGKNRRPFKFYQFRVKRVGTDEDACRVSHWMRRAGLDEVAQIFNVLNGTMSIVGPRPFLEEEEITFSSIPRWNERYAVAPGLTGPSEVHFPARDFGSKGYDYRACALPFDLDYIKNRSAWSYLAVLFGSLNNLWKGHDHTPANHSSR